MTTDKPTAEELCERLGRPADDLPWRTSGAGAGMFQVAIVRLDDGTPWVLVRLAGEPGVQVYSEHEWNCFIDGVRNSEFDDLR